jgi:sialic acid synthase SpsE
MAALAMGARIVEKHFTLDTSMHGPDHEGSMDPGGLELLVQFRNELRICLK